MKSFGYIILALISSAIAIISFGTLLVSCAGHPPQIITSAIGIWILPLSFWGTGIFAALSSLFWIRAFQRGDKTGFKAKISITRSVNFLLSFAVSIICFLFFSLGTTYLAINSSLSNSVFYSIYAISTIISIYLGFFTYKKLSKKNV